MLISDTIYGIIPILGILIRRRSGPVRWQLCYCELAKNDWISTASGCDPGDRGYIVFEACILCLQLSSGTIGANNHICTIVSYRRFQGLPSYIQLSRCFTDGTYTVFGSVRLLSWAVVVFGPSWAILNTAVSSKAIVLVCMLVCDRFNDPRS